MVGLWFSRAYQALGSLCAEPASIQLFYGLLVERLARQMLMVAIVGLTAEASIGSDDACPEDLKLLAFAENKSDGLFRLLLVTDGLTAEDKHVY